MNNGHLTIRSCWLDGHFGHFDVLLDRPDPARLFVGMAPSRVLQTVPLLYALCGQAQRTAAAAAIAAACEQPQPPVDSRPLWIEALHEHLWRLLLDWPQALGFEPPREAFAVWRKCRQADLPTLLAATRRLLRTCLLGRNPEQPVGKLTAAPRDSLAGECLLRLGTEDLSINLEQIDADPEMDPATWLAHWRAGSAARLPPAALKTPLESYRLRLQAILNAYRGLHEDLPYAVGAAGGKGCGIGQVRTSRGILTHCVRVEAGGEEGVQISAYRVWAPTDLHFADGTALDLLLRDLHTPDLESARQAVAQAVLALDPCVPHGIELTQGGGYA